MTTIDQVLEGTTDYYFRIEIVDFKDLSADSLEPYATQVMKTLQSLYPNLIRIWSGITDNLWNFDGPELIHLQSSRGYCIVYAGNVDLREVKKTCISLESNTAGIRIADIDIYLPDKSKLTRTDPENHNPSNKYGELMEK